MVRKNHEEDFVYYYPKMMTFSAEFIFADVGSHRGVPTDEDSWSLPPSRISFVFGGGLVLSRRILSDVFPNAGFLFRLPISEKTFFNSGLVYSGNFLRGAWTFPFGFGYVF